MSRRLLLVAGAAMLLTSGCFFKLPGATAPPPQTAPLVAATMPSTEPTAPPPEHSQALAQTTSLYAKTLEQHMLRRDRRGESATRPATLALTTSPVEPTLPDVKWLEPPVQFALGPPQRADGAYPTRNDRAEELTNANQPAVVAVVPGTISPFPTPTPLKAPAAAEAAPLSDQLEQKLQQQVKDYPRDLAAQLDYQLLQLVRGRAVPQMDSIAGLPAEDRELVAALLDGLSNLRSVARGEENALLGKKVRPLIEMADRLRSQGNLRIGAIALCSRVDGFGVYEPIESDRFLSTREQTMILYCEVENFASRLTDHKQWETNLTQEAVLYNDRGQRVWEDKRRTIADQSRNRRHDFFVVRKIKLPAGLPTGRYRLVVTIADQQAGRVTEGDTALTMVTK